MSKFRVGEIAVLQNAANPTDNGMEVEVIALPRADSWMFDRTWRVIPSGHYVIRADVGPDGTPYWGCGPDQLRKRRPPQDWTKLCNLDSIPKEISCAV